MTFLETEMKELGRSTQHAHAHTHVSSICDGILMKAVNTRSTFGSFFEIILIPLPKISKETKDMTYSESLV